MVLYVLAAVAFVIAMVDLVVGAWTEGGLMFLLAIVLAAIGLYRSKTTTRECPACRARIPKLASKCRFCGSDVAPAEKTPRPVSDQR